MPYNIVVVEDDKLHRDELVKALRADHGHAVEGYRDKVTFEAAAQAEVLPFKDKRPLLVILDIMIAAELDKDKQCAPRWKEVDPPSDADRRRHVDDELGLRIAQEIRQGEFEPAIPRGTPIVFFTARQNDRIKEHIERMKPALWLPKPQFADDVEEAIQKLMARHGEPQLEGKTNDA